MLGSQKFNDRYFIELFVILMICVCLKSNADEVEFTPYIGNMFSSELQNVSEESPIMVSDDLHLGFAIAWQATPTGQGQILINYVNHQISGVQDNNDSFELLYAHFSGVGHYGKHGYTTTLGIGFGASYMKSSLNDGIYPSSTIAIGTRYIVSAELTFVTELRAYATLIKEEDNLFCNNNECLAVFEGTIWIDTSISVGFAYKF